MRNGKIASLPPGVREELNGRMANGEDGRLLLEWLNGLAETRACLKADFDGAPISKQNLCEWRRGGFREWQIQQELIGQAYRLSAGCSALDEVVDRPLLAGDLVTVVAARYAGLLNSWDGEAEPKFEEKLRVLRGVAHDVALVQRALHRAMHQQNEFEQKLEDDAKKVEEEVRQRKLAPIWAAYESEPLAKLFGGGEEGRKLAEIVCSTNHGLPLPKMELPAAKEAGADPPGQTQSKPVKPKGEV